MPKTKADEDIKEDIKIEWMRPSGNPITTNDWPETIKYADELGWERVGEAPKKRGRPSKEEG